MLEMMLMMILILVYYNSKLWQKGEWRVIKTKWIYWRKRREV